MEENSSSASSLPNVAKASAIVMASLLMSRVLGIIREMIMNWKFGQSVETDAYRLAFQIPDLLFFLIAGGALSSAFIPVFSEYFHTERKAEAWKIFSSVVTVMSTLLVALISLAWVFAVPLARLIAPGKDEATIQMIAEMSRILLPAQFAFFIGGLMAGTLYVRQVFSIPALGPNLYNLGIIFGALVISSLVSPAVSGMTWGATLGAFIGSMALPLWMMRRIGSEFRPSYSLAHPGTRKVFKLMAPVVLGLSLPSVFPMIIQYFASPLGEGVNSAMANANQLMQAPLGIFGQSLALAVFPALSQFFAQKREDLFEAQLEKSLRQALYLATPVAVLMAIVPVPLIRVLFEHGQFRAEDTARTALALTAFAVGIVGWCMQPILMRAYFSIQRTITPVIMGTLTTLVFVTLCLVIRGQGYPFFAYPLAGSACAFLLVGMLVAGLKKRFAGLGVANLGRTLGLSLFSSLLGIGLVWLTVQVTARLPIVAFIGAFGIACILYAWIYYFVTKSFQMPEATYLDRAFARLNRKTPSEPGA